MHSVICVMLLLLAATDVGDEDLLADDPNDAFIATTNQGLAITLDDAVSIALRANFDIRSQYINRVAERFALYVAQDKFRPHVSLTGSTSYAWDAGPATVQDQNGFAANLVPHAEILLATGTKLTADLGLLYENPMHTYTDRSSAALSLEVSQPLLKNRGVEVNLASVDVATLTEQMRQINLKNNIIATISNVISGFRAFALATRARDIAQVAVQRSKDLLGINLQMVAAGRMARADLIQTQAEIASREVNLMNAQSDYITTQVALLELLAMARDTPIVAVAEDTPRWRAPPRAEVLRRAFEHRPEYLMGLLSKHIAAKNLVIAHNNRQWDLSLFARHVRGGVEHPWLRGWGDAGAGPSHSTSVGLALAVPLIDVTLRQQVVQSEVAFDQADLQWVQTRYDIELRIDAATRTLDIRTRHLALAIRARRLAEKKLANEREKLGVGRSSNFEVIRFVDDLVNAEVAEINTTIAYLNAITDMKVQMGTLLDPWDVVIR